MVKRNFGKVLNFCFVMACVVHNMFIIYNSANPENPEIMIYNKNIRDIEIPISLLLCLSYADETIENDRYKKVGYEDNIRFYSGTSIFNESIIGWFGHMENGSTYDSIEGKHFI